MKVTNVDKRKSYVLIKFDNDTEILIHYELFLSQNIFEGREYTRKEIDEILDLEIINKIKFTVFYYLGRRAHSRKELVNKLIKKEYSLNLINKGLDRIEELGYIDDHKFAELYFEEKLFKKKKGINKINAELFQKGVSREIIDSVSSSFLDDDIHLKNALAFGEKKLKSLKRKETDYYRIKSKIFAHLQMKGFQSDVISKVIEKLSISNNDEIN